MNKRYFRLYIVLTTGLIVCAAAYYGKGLMQKSEDYLDSLKAPCPLVQESTELTEKADTIADLRKSVPSTLVDKIAHLKATGRMDDLILANAIEIAWENLSNGLDFLKRNEAVSDFRNLRKTLLIAIFSERLADFGRIVDAIETPSARKSVENSVFKHWAMKDPLALGNYAAGSLEGASRNHAMLETVSSLARIGDLDNARRYFQTITDRKDRAMALNALTEPSRKTDVQADVDWASSLTEPTEKARALSRIIGGAANSMEPGKMIERANASSDELTRKVWVSAATASLLNGDLDTARQWIESLPNEYRDRAKSELAGRLASKFPGQAATYTNSIIDDNNRVFAIDLMLLAIGPEKGKVDEWFPLLASDLQERAATGIIRNLFQVAPQDAVEWACALPNGASKDRANFTLVSLYKKAEPDRVKAVSQINDPTLRAYALKMLSDKE